MLSFTFKSKYDRGRREGVVNFHNPNKVVHNIRGKTDVPGAHTGGVTVLGEL